MLALVVADSFGFPDIYIYHSTYAEAWQGVTLSTHYWYGFLLTPPTATMVHFGSVLPLD
jgi:hypothetical protein